MSTPELKDLMSDAHQTQHVLRDTDTTSCYVAVIEGTDHQRVVEIFLGAHQTTLTNRAVANEYFDRFLEDLTRPKSVTLGVYVDNGVLIGFLNASPCAFDAECVSLNQLCVAWQWQRSGVGKLLVRTLEDHCRHHFDTVFLSTDKPKYYERLAYQIVSQTYRKQWLVMVKSIADRW